MVETAKTKLHKHKPKTNFSSYQWVNMGTGWGLRSEGMGGGCGVRRGGEDYLFEIGQRWCIYIYETKIRRYGGENNLFEIGQRWCI